jgi:hypothetical protein
MTSTVLHLITAKENVACMVDDVKMTNKSSTSMESIPNCNRDGGAPST